MATGPQHNYYNKFQRLLILLSATNSNFKLDSEYTYLGIALRKSGSYKLAISNLTAAGKRALLLCNISALTWALMISACNVLCFLRLCSLFCLYGCEIWGLEHATSWECMSSIHGSFLKRTLHVRKSTPTEAFMCELGQMPLSPLA